MRCGEENNSRDLAPPSMSAMPQRRNPRRSEMTRRANMRHGAADRTTNPLNFLLLSPVYLWLLIQNSIQKRTMYLHLAVITDEAQFSEFVHEETHAGSRRADHFRQRSHWIDGLRVTFFAEIGEKK
jgi:hypothetical protein